MTARTASQLFVVELAVELAFKRLAQKAALIFSGPIGWILSHFAKRFLGHMIATGILMIDLERMSKSVDVEEKEYKDAIKKAYVNTKGKTVSEADKKRLRQLVIDATRKFVRVRTQSRNT